MENLYIKGTKIIESHKIKIKNGKEVSGGGRHMHTYTHIKSYNGYREYWK